MEQRVRKTINQKSDLMLDWDYSKNQELNIYPDKESISSGKKVWWKCHVCKTEWITAIVSRCYGKTGCPHCSAMEGAKKSVETRIKKYGSFATNYPDLLKEWNYEMNDKLGIYPNKVTAHSEKKAFWKCPICEHSYKAQISHRTNGTACPKCAGEFRTSFPEQAIYYYLKQYYKNVQNRYILNEQEIDIYIPELKTGIEYDGNYFHKGKSSLQREQKKYKILKENHIKLIRIKESNNKEYMQENADYFLVLEKRNNYKCLEDVIYKVFNILKTKGYNIDINRDRVKIYNQYLSSIKNNSIEKLHPQIAKEWCYERNGALKPSMISRGTAKKLWWKCEKGHYWEAAVYTRTQGHGCPYCAGQRAISGKNDLETKFPEIAKEWDYNRNKINPNQVMSASNKKVWWLCRNNHSYYTSPNARTGEKHAQCPICSGRKVLKGFNDFETRFPELLKQWDYAENNRINIFPDRITSNSNKKVYWKCEKGHKWIASVNSRTRNTNSINCPICMNKQVLEGYNDFASQFPYLLKEWNYSKNNDLGIYPNKVSLNAMKAVWWKCLKCGNEWKTKIYQRTVRENNCPKCAAKNAPSKRIRTIISKNGSFADNYPELLKEWDYSKNNKNGIFPENITSGSHQKVWWKCKNGHSFNAIVKSRTRKNGTGCPVCAKKVSTKVL